MVDAAFVEARWFTKVAGTRRIDYVVLHDMETSERLDSAEDVARYFAAGTVKASAHYNVDADSIVQSVRENDIAYHAPPNTHSIGVEHAGFARQTRAQWLDPYGLAMLRRSAALVRDLCDKYDLPRTFLTVTDLRQGKRGVTTHANVSKAFGLSTHTDPGVNFPIDHYMALVKITPTPVTPPAPAPTPEDDVNLTDPIEISAALAEELGLGDRRSYTVGELIRGGWVEAARANRDLDQIDARIDAAVRKALAESVVKVDISVNQPGGAA